jgi:hypothetical protein
MFISGFSSSQQGLRSQFPHVPLNLDRDLVSDLCAGHRKHKALDA